MIPLSNNKLVFLLLFIGAAIICSGIILTYQTKKLFDNSAVKVTHTYDVISATQKVLIFLQDLQINTLSYNNSGDSALAVSIRYSATQISDAIRKLKVLTLDNPYQGPRIDSISRFSEYLIADISKNLILRKEGSTLDGDMFYLDGKGKQYLYSIKTLLGKIQAVENNLLYIRKNANQKSILILDQIILFLFSLQPLLILTIFFTLRHGVRIRKQNEKQQALYESIVLSSEDAIISRDLDGIITSWNRGARNLFQYAGDEIIGRHISVLIPPNRLQEEKEISAKMGKNRSIDTYDTERIRRDGSSVNVALTISPLRDANGNIVGACKIVRDITRRKTNEEALVIALKETSDYKYALDESAIVAITDQHGFIKHVNENFCKISKYSAKELIGRDHRIINSKHHTKEFIRNLWSTITSGKIWKGELKNKAKDGATYWVDTTIVPFLNELGKPYQYVAIRADITQRKLNEEALANSLKDISDYKYALDESAIVAITDQRGIIRHVNANFCKISKYTAEELIGKDHRIINSGYHTKEFIRNIWVTIANGKIWKGELKNKAKNGDTYWVDTTIVPFLNDQGKPYQYIAIRADITDRKQAEEENVKNEIRFRNTLDKMLEGVEIIGFDYRYLYVNDAYERQVKYTRKELLGFTLMEKFPGIEKTKIFSAIDQCFEERVAIHLEEEFTFSDNTKTWFEISFQPVSEGVFILSVDITEKKHAEKKIRQSEERFRALIENSYDVVSIIDKDFRPLYRSPSAIRISGWTNEEIEKEGSIRQIHPDDKDALFATLKNVSNNPGIAYPMSFRTQHKNGDYIFVDGTITNMLHNEAIGGIVTNFHDVTETRKVEEQLRKSEKIYKTIAAGIPGSVICLLDKDYRYFLVEGDMLEAIGYFKKDLLGNTIQDVLQPDILKEVLPFFQRAFQGESFTVENYRSGFDVLTRYVPLRGEGNTIFAVMIVLFDVSELKNAQRAITKLNIGLEDKIKDRTLELEMVNKELEAFSYSVAHDLRTPLRAIYGYSTMLDEDYRETLDDEGQRLISRVVYNAKRMGTLIDDLLTFSRLGRKEVQKSLVNVKQITETCLQDLNLKEGFSGKLIIHELHAVMADASLLRYVMINLLSNAVKYSSKKEKPVIEISSEQKGAEIIYSVKDNGVGFDMDYADKLFGVFQRLHSSEEFDGTGVGLATVQRIIHKHHGHIWAEAKVNQGATFYFSLPAKELIVKSS